jgi:hypothetical protein
MSVFCAWSCAPPPWPSLSLACGPPLSSCRAQETPARMGVMTMTACCCHELKRNPAWVVGTERRSSCWKQPLSADAVLQVMRGQKVRGRYRQQGGCIC